MIGQLVEHILTEGFDVSVHQTAHMLILRISKMVDKEHCYVDWVVSREELARVRTAAPLLDGWDQRVQRLRDAIAKKHAAMGTDPKE